MVLYVVLYWKYKILFKVNSDSVKVSVDAKLGTILYNFACKDDACLKESWSTYLKLRVGEGVGV